MQIHLQNVVKAFM